MDVFLQLQWGLQFGNLQTLVPALFAGDETKAAILKLASNLVDDGSQERGLIPAAACGDKDSLVKLAALYTNSGAASAPKGGLDHGFLQKYLTTISCQRDGDQLTEVVDHIATAVYDPTTCIWSVPKD